MGTRNYRGRESKKPKKGTKKPSPVNLVSTPQTVEVIKKGKQSHEQEEG